ncbi:hypothetical protein LMG22037_05497 [Paraburkholderia phenoliruptrix]|uniref:Uncharacterized protein n=1 Tax=Paraburkholderia phenoliruptrix TaxID=252970 RepID=A0A6J5CB11_9BURK|nr:hypothetical protein [Paraburkholderia phenoliruptrix]CAB3730013.1 hypothetical protein LMG22037_05497 [Paraburkholderia phenoliruptrix]
MTPEQKIKHMILARYADLYDCAPRVPESVTADNIDALYTDVYGNDDGSIWDAINEVRCGEVETKLPCEWSRHYESKAVASRYFDGSWVGWTYWYGGGKHGEPEAVDWMDVAYALSVTEEEKTVVVRTFAKAA